MADIKVNCSELVCEIKVDCRGENCPIPLVETRKAIRRAAPGDVIEIQGTHVSSKKEIPLALEALNLEILETRQDGDVWTIRIQR